MNIISRHFRLFVFGLTLFFLLGSDTAIAQHESTSNQNLEPGDATAVPADWIPAAVSLRSPSDSWAPPDIDAVRPPVEPTASCSLPEVVSQAGMRVEELTHNLDRFSATEIIEHQTVGRSGNLHHPDVQKFNYMFSMKEKPDGYMLVDEYRDMSMSQEPFSDHVATRGTPSLVLVFHPNYVKNFQMSCEGLGTWHGQPAWQIRFEQRPDSANNMSAVIIDGKTYNVRLRGRAWILADSYQVAQMEMDIAETIPKIRLRMQHMAIEYLPVLLPNSNREIWLPASAELYEDFKGHQFVQRHTYTNFKLFSVKVHQELGDIE